MNNDHNERYGDSLLRRINGETVLNEAKWMLLARAGWAGKYSRIWRACVLKSPVQCGSHESGNGRAVSIDRDDANSCRAYHKCSVDGCPCRVDFSGTAYLVTASIGKSTFGEVFAFYWNHYRYPRSAMYDQQLSQIFTSSPSGK